MSLGATNNKHWFQNIYGLDNSICRSQLMQSSWVLPLLPLLFYNYGLRAVYMFRNSVKGGRAIQICLIVNEKLCNIFAH